MSHLHVLSYLMFIFTLPVCITWRRQTSRIWCNRSHKKMNWSILLNYWPFYRGILGKRSWKHLIPSVCTNGINVLNTGITSRPQESPPLLGPCQGLWFSRLWWLRICIPNVLLLNAPDGSPLTPGLNHTLPSSVIWPCSQTAAGWVRAKFLLQCRILWIVQGLWKPKYQNPLWDFALLNGQILEHSILCEKWLEDDLK